MNNSGPYYIIVLGLFLCICAPTLWSDGMFMDGLYYASISRNLADGIGSFWYLHHTDFSHPIFHEHPPLAIGIQSFFFYFLGDSIYIERIYSLCTFIITAMIIHLIWKKVSKKELKNLSWIPLLFWIMIPLNSWACSNNILENTMNIFVSLSVLLSLKSLKRKKFKNTFLAGICLSLAFLSKGFAGLFPLSIFFWYFIVFKEMSINEMFSRTFWLFFFTLSPFILLFLLCPSAIESIHQYINQQVVRSINHIQTVDTRFYIIKRFILDLAPALTACLITLYFSFKKKFKLHLQEKKWLLFFLFLGASGVLPIMISMKQSSFYILTVFPFFSIALSILIAPFIAYIIPKKKTKTYILGLFFLIVSIFLSVKQIGVVGRDYILVKDVKSILAVIGENSIISIDENMCKNYQLIGYFSRYGNVSLNKKEKLYYHISYTKENKNLLNYRQVKISTKNLILYTRNK